MIIHNNLSKTKNKILSTCLQGNYKLKTEIHHTTFPNYWAARVKMKVCNRYTPGAPLTYFNDGGVQVIFLGLKFWPKVIFLGLKDAAIFLGRKKNNGGIFLGCEKRTKGFFWVC